MLLRIIFKLKQFKGSLNNFWFLLRRDCGLENLQNSSKNTSKSEQRRKMCFFVCSGPSFGGNKE